MKIPATQRLIVEDFPEQKDWIPPLFYVLNKFITDVIATVNGNVDFSENIPGVEKSFEFTYVSHTASLPLTFTWGLRTRPKALSVVAAFERASGTYVDNPVIACAAWQYTNANEVQVTDLVLLNGSSATVVGLAVGNRYKITIRVSA